VVARDNTLYDLRRYALFADRFQDIAFSYNSCWRRSRERLQSSAFWRSGSASLFLRNAAKPAFDIADVHVSPRTEWVKDLNHNLQGGFLVGDRYELHRATLLDMIRIAYSVDADKVYGGPSWIDYDRFEVDAKTKSGTLLQI
jgi:Protein of unknown function (DUF3738)